MRRITMRRARRGERGLTLVELMIALLLSTILVGGMFYMTSNQQVTYSDQMAEMGRNEGLWGTMLYLERQLQRAGYGFGGCPGARLFRYDSTTGTTEGNTYVGLRIYDDCNLFVSDPATCPDGSGIDSFTVTSARDDMPAIETPGPAAGDVPTRGQSMRVQTEVLTSASQVELDPNTLTYLQFQNGDLFSLWDPEQTQCVMLEATGSAAACASGANVCIPHATSATHNLVTFPSLGYRAGALVTRLGAASGANAFVPRHFAIDTTRNPPHLVTWQTAASPPSSPTSADIVAEGVVDMQLAYACDGDRNGFYFEADTAAGKQSDEWVFNFSPGASDNVPAGCDKPEIVRITLTGQTPGVVNQNSTGDVGAQSTLRSTVRLRNMNTRTN